MDVARNRFPRLVLAAVLLVSGCSGPTVPGRTADEAARAPSVPVTLSGVAADIVDLTNAERTRAGLTALRANPRLIEAARLQARQLTEAGRLDHVLPDARYPGLADRLDAAGYRWQAAGENLAFGQRTAAALVAAWMDSSGHRTNILHTSYTDIGVAHLVDPNGRPYSVQVFARPAP